MLERMDGSPSPRLAGLVLAAGAARRFGAPKQLAPLDGRPLVEHALAAMAGVAGVERVVLTLGAHADEILAGIDLHGAQPLLVPDWEEGQAASLRAGVAALAPGADAIVVTLGDQPRVGGDAIARIAAEALGPAPAARAVYGGVPGHPVLITRPLYAAVAGLRGDAGARDLLRQAGALEVECGPDAVLDVDTPAQLDALRGGDR
jgi:molybdenum cofactor cytidylyltransferase